MFPENKRLLKNATDENDQTFDDEGGSDAPRAPKSKMRVWAEWIVGTALLASLGVGVTYGLHTYATTSRRFAVTSIVVNGNAQRSYEDVLRVAGVKLGENMFVLRFDEVVQRVAQDPWIESVRWARRLPGTVELVVTERKAVALLSLSKLYLVSASGKVFKAYEPGDPSDLPVVTGFHEEDVQLDAPGFREELKKGLEVLAEYNDSTLQAKWPVSEINRSLSGSYALVVGRSATRVSLGGAHFRRKLEQVRKVFGELERRNVEASDILAENEARS